MGHTCNVTLLKSFPVQAKCQHYEYSLYYDLRHSCEVRNLTGSFVFGDDGKDSGSFKYIFSTLLQLKFFLQFMRFSEDCTSSILKTEDQVFVFS